VSGGITSCPFLDYRHMRAALAAFVCLLLVLPLALASNGNGVLEEARQRDPLAKDHVDVSATSAHPKGEEARRGMLFKTHRSNTRRQDVRRIDGRSSRRVALPPLAESAFMDRKMLEGRGWEEGTKDSEKDARHRVVVREYDADGQVVLERLEWHEEDDESMFTHSVPRRGHHAEGIHVPGQEAMPGRQTEPSNGPASNRGRRVSIDQGSTPLSTCTSAMCTFAVDAAGVLSRTGGSECGDPSCGFLSLSGLSITSIAQGAFAGMVHLKMLDMSNNRLASITHDDLKDLTGLKTLALNSNLLSTIAPGTFAGLSGVEHLSLSENKLVSISEGSFEGLSGLLSLNLDDNGGGAVYTAAGNYDYTVFLEIEDFSFRHMPLLTTLSIQQSSSCRSGGLRGIGNDTFSGGLIHLETLNLCCNCAGMDIDGIAPRAFAELPGLKTLDLRNNAIRQQDVEPGLFRHCGNLTTLSLRNNHITSLSESTFAGLAGSLKSIELSNYDPLMISSISVATFEGFSKLSHIQLEGNRLSIIPADTFANIGSSYTYVDLDRNPLICAPRKPSNVDLWLGQDSSSLPPCPSQVRPFCMQDVEYRKKASVRGKDMRENDPDSSLRLKFTLCQLAAARCLLHVCDGPMLLQATPRLAIGMNHRASHSLYSLLCLNRRRICAAHPSALLPWMRRACSRGRAAASAGIRRAGISRCRASPSPRLRRVPLRACCT
jgi:Leucine-rich repeat (LRR) protein